MTTLSRAEAQEVIAEIRAKNGGITPEVRARTPREALAAIDRLSRIASAATMTLTTELYSRDTRFVYELVQNAEDNEYTRTAEEGPAPYIHFKLYPNKIIIDSNEDGFTEANVQAICSVGESSKGRIGGYIGEKGIGFKSVFKIAKQVKIQSGPFSFSFSHSQDSGDPGLGMITPMDEPYEELPQGVHTRFILTLLDSQSFERTAGDFETLPHTLLLFLSKLKRLQISIYPPEKPPIETIYQMKCGDGNFETITKEIQRDGQRTTTTLRYFVLRKEITDLPEDQARKVKQGETWWHVRKASVVLAFPLDDEDVPILDDQHVYAFLPLRKAGFNFLIQSDFITQASREDVRHSPWNEALLSGVAETFKDAVLRFCEHKSLQYSWPQYLPKDSISDEFWKKLRPKIQNSLQRTRILRSWSGKGLHFPSQLHIVTWPLMLDEHRNPLFPDLPDEIYLAKGYSRKDYESLKSLGTEIISVQLLLRTIQEAAKGADFKIHSENTDDHWHSRVSKLLLYLFDSVSSDRNPDRHPIRVGLRKLPLIPLHDSTWVSAVHLPIYFPTIASSDIPDDLNLQLVHPKAVANADRKKLYEKLGVVTCKPEEVIKLIYSKYRAVTHATSLNQSIRHYKFLYWNLPEGQDHLDSSMHVFEEGYLYRLLAGSGKNYIYFGDSAEEYGPRNLFNFKPLDSTTTAARFLHPLYLPAVADSARSHGISWRQWLERCAGICEIPQLLHRDGMTISSECKLLIENAPKKALGMLKHHWLSYEAKTSVIIKVLQNFEFPTLAGDAKPLEETYLPLPELRSIVDEVGAASFPFIQLPESPGDNVLDEWCFLKTLNVGTQEDFRFYRTLTAHLPSRKAGESSESDPEYLGKLCKIYRGLNNHCISETDRTSLRKLFGDASLIYVPKSTSSGPENSWHRLQDVLWIAPKWLRRKPGLQNVEQYNRLAEFFQNTLGIRDVSHQDFLDELEVLASSHLAPRAVSDHVGQVYQWLWRDFQNSSDFSVLRDAFEKKKLVYFDSDETWYPLSSCTWARSSVTFPSKISIATKFATLSDFFQRILGVSSPDLGMHVLALKRLNNKGQASPSDVKAAIVRISAMSPTQDALRDLKNSNIFSVRLAAGSLQWTNSLGEFVISDRKEYEEAFQGLIPIWDLSREEVRTCRSFLIALGLDRKYLSRQVSEETRVTDGEQDRQLTRRLRERAQAVYRCAVHYESPRMHEDRSLLDLLQNSAVFTSSSISKRMTVMHYQTPVFVDVGAGKLHLEEANGELHVYVPRDQRDRELCYLQLLPKRLLEYLGISDNEAVSTVGSVINCSTLSVVDAILDQAGIVEVPGLPVIPDPDGEERSPSPTDREERSLSTQDRADQRVPLYDSDTTETEAETISTVSNVPTPLTGMNSTRITPNRSPSPFDLQRFEARAQSSGQARVVVSEQVTRTHFAQAEALVPVPPQQPQGYAALLNRIIRSVDGASLPECGFAGTHWSSDPIASSRTSETIFQTRSFDRDKKVGAAGELLIFEMLSQLHLPGFSRQNWQSTIRDEVRVCDKYRDLVPWNGFETADIMYNDTDSVFTRLLVAKGYLPHSWISCQPTYSFEVKTTTGDCETDFYMSGSQYRRMLSMKLGQNRAPNSPCLVYIIFRVFKLEQDEIGLKLYVDPETARVDGELEFNVHTYAVKSLAAPRQSGS